MILINTSPQLIVIGEKKELLYLIRGYYSSITTRFLLDYGEDISKIDTKIKDLSKDRIGIKKKQIKTSIDLLRRKTGLSVIEDVPNTTLWLQLPNSVNPNLVTVARPRQVIPAQVMQIDISKADPTEMSISDKEIYNEELKRLKEYISNIITKGLKMDRIADDDVKSHNNQLGTYAFPLPLRSLHGYVWSREQIARNIAQASFQLPENKEEKIVFSLNFHTKKSLFSCDINGGHSITCVIYPKIKKVILLDSNGFFSESIFKQSYSGMTLTDLKICIIDFIAVLEDSFKVSYTINSVEDIILIPSFNLQTEICGIIICSEREKGTCNVFASFIRNTIIHFKHLNILDIIDVINEEVVFKDHQYLFALVRYIDSIMKLDIKKATSVMGHAWKGGYLPSKRISRGKKNLMYLAKRPNRVTRSIRSTRVIRSTQKRSRGKRIKTKKKRT